MPRLELGHGCNFNSWASGLRSSGFQGTLASHAEIILVLRACVPSEFSMNLVQAQQGDQRGAVHHGSASTPHHSSNQPVLCERLVLQNTACLLSHRPAVRHTSTTCKKTRKAQAQQTCEKHGKARKRGSRCLQVRQSIDRASVNLCDVTMHWSVGADIGCWQ